MVLSILFSIILFFSSLQAIHELGSYERVEEIKWGRV